MSKTVAELIKELQELPQDLPVIMSRDEEGNGYSDEIDVTCEDILGFVTLYPGRMQEIDEIDGFLGWPDDDED